jgi:hypothetical protein
MSLLLLIGYACLHVVLFPWMAILEVIHVLSRGNTMLAGARAFLQTGSWMRHSEVRRELNRGNATLF